MSPSFVVNVVSTKKGFGYRCLLYTPSPAQAGGLSRPSTLVHSVGSPHQLQQSPEDFLVIWGIRVGPVAPRGPARQSAVSIPRARPSLLCLLATDWAPWLPRLG